MPKKEGDKKLLICPSCGYKVNANETKIKEKTEIKSKEELAIVEKEEEVLPLVDEECPKCHNKEAYFWEIQTRAGDEPATKFFKCKKCKHIWRDYS